MVGAEAGLELVQQPEPGLGEGGGIGGEAGLRVWVRAGGCGCQGGGGVGREGELRLQGGDGGVGDEGGEGQNGAERLLQAAQQPHARERMAPHQKEAVVDAEGAMAEHLGPEGVQPLLALAPGRHPGGIGARAGGGGGLGGGLGQERAAVQLAVRREGPAIEPEEAGGHQPLRQAAPQLLLQGPGPRAGGIRRAAGLEPGGEGKAAGRCGQRHHQGPLHLRQRLQRRFHLPRLQPPAGDLDLGIAAPHEREQAIGPEPGQIARAEAAQGGIPGLGHEALGGGLRIAPVALGQVAAGAFDLADRPDGHGLAVVPQQAQGPVGELAPHRRGAGGQRRLGAEEMVGVEGGSLRGADPQVEPAGAGDAGPEGLQIGAVDAIASQVHQPQIGQPLAWGQGLEQQAKDARDRVQHRDPFAADHLQNAGGAQLRQGQGHQAGAVEQGAVDVAQRPRHAGGIQLGESILGPQVGGVAVLHHVVQQAALVLQHPLGLAGGAGGEQQPGGIRAPQGAGGGVVGGLGVVGGAIGGRFSRLGPSLRVEDEPGLGGAQQRASAGPTLRGADHQGGRGPLQDAAVALQREGGIEGHRQPAGVEHGQQGHRCPGVVGQQHRHRRLRIALTQPGHQFGRQGLHPGLQLPVGPAAAAIAQGRPLAMALHHPAEAIGHRQQRLRRREGREGQRHRPAVVEGTHRSVAGGSGPGGLE